MKKYIVYINGCDDSTVFDLELTEEELKVVKKLSDHSHFTSHYGCMPTLDVEKGELKEIDEDDYSTMPDVISGGREYKINKRLGGINV